MAADVALVWANARAYNQDGSQILALCDVAEAALRSGWEAAGLPLASANLPPPGAAACSARAGHRPGGRGGAAAVKAAAEAEPPRSRRGAAAEDAVPRVRVRVARRM